MAKMKVSAVWPPPPPENETEEERKARLAAEEEAKRVSDSIDRAIALERERRKRRKSIKLLLLGQAESGKSTILKNFQIHFSPKAFEAEAGVWRPIIHLNLVRSINFILNFLSTGGSSTVADPTVSPKPLVGELRRLALSLAPLREVELSLVQSIPGSVGSSPDMPSYNPAKASEVAITSGTGWRGFLRTGRRSGELSDNTWQKTSDVNSRILMACADDMERLWEDEGVRRRLREHGISLHDQSGFFLDDVKRITRETYTPTSNDILRARVQTLGPQEHHIHLEIPTEHANVWTIYDVGGSRSQRTAWAQFFDDMDMIIFLAPLSAFDQTLEEDITLNRLTDSMRLWQAICSNRILRSVELILFLNKLDILDAKLKDGIQFNKHFSAFTGVNETKAVAKHLVDKFVALHVQNAPERKRKIYPHLTCAIDIGSTAKIIDRVYQVIVFKYLAHSRIL